MSEFAKLWAAADAIWTRNDRNPPFEGYVSADYQAVYESLVPFQNREMTFLEWGSGLGVIAIMASRMGFDSFGIEAEFELLEHAEKLSRTFDSTTRFAHGSFIPDEFEWNLSEGDEAERTMVDLPAAYDQLDLELRDFDLIFGYPWPGEHRLFRNIVREHGRPDTMLMTYDAREGVELIHFD